jgi:(S)-sulfolactate dehydrogenase
VLKVVGRLGVGLDNIDVDACRERRIEVIPATGRQCAGRRRVRDRCRMFLLRGAYASSAAVANGEWPRPALANGREVAGKILGVVGFGCIGRIVAVSHAPRNEGDRFDSEIAASADVWNAEQASPRALPALLAEADVVTLHVPLVAETRHLIDAAHLARMKAGAILINTSRGGVVDETAVAMPLRAHRLGGAALDVFEQEPLAAGSPLAGCRICCSRRTSRVSLPNRTCGCRR